MTKPELGDGSTDDFLITCTYFDCEQKFMVDGNLNNEPMNLIMVVCPHCGNMPILFGLAANSLFTRSDE